MPVSRGDNLSIPASVWNEVLAMLKDWQTGRLGGGPRAQISSVNRGIEILIKNTTSSNIAAFGVLALSTPCIDFTVAVNDGEQFNGIRFDGIAPSTSTPHYGKFCVLQEPCASGSFARAILSGPTLAKVFITDADDGAADIVNGDTSTLVTAAVGTARVIWKEPGVTGANRAALLDLGDPILCGVGKANGVIAKDAVNGNVNVWDVLFAGATGQTLANCINHTRDIADGNKVAWQVILPSGRILVSSLDCD